MWGSYLFQHMVLFGYVYVWTFGLGVPFFSMLCHSCFVWSIGHFGHCFKAQLPKPYFVLAQNIKLVHSFITGRMNLPVPLVFGTTLAKPFYLWIIWWELASLHLHVLYVLFVEWYLTSLLSCLLEQLIELSILRHLFCFSTKHKARSFLYNWLNELTSAICLWYNIWQNRFILEYLVEAYISPFMYLICFICGMVSYITPLMPSRTTY